MVDPTLLYAHEAEMQVLGQLMNNPEKCRDEVFGTLNEDDFHNPANIEIFNVIKHLNDTLKPIEENAIHQELVNRKKDVDVNSPSCLFLMKMDATINLVHYVNTVKDKSYLRKLRDLCMETLDTMNDNPKSPEIFAHIESGLTKINSGAMTVERTYSEIGASFERFITSDERIPSVLTGFHTLDELTGGFRGGQYIAIGADSGKGKTALALTFAMNIAEGGSMEVYDEEEFCYKQVAVGGTPVGVISLEMGGEEVYARNVALTSGMDLSKIRNKRMTEGERTRLIEEIRRHQGFKVYLNEDNPMTITKLKSIARKWKRKNGIKLLVVDYIGLMKPEKGQHGETREMQVATISRELKGLARELDIAILVLTQLNRKAVENNQDPGAHNIRESSAIQHDSDLIILLSEDPDEEIKVDGEVPYVINLCKQRNGPTKRIPAIFRTWTARFLERH